jgi:hypothetical protein
MKLPVRPCIRASGKRLIWPRWRAEHYALAVTDRTPAQQRDLLVNTVRFVAEWRHEQAEKYDQAESADPYSKTRSLRAEAALRGLAEFVHGLDDDDPLLKLRTLRKVEDSGGKLILTPEGFDLLSRFRMSVSTRIESDPTEAQMRNILKRLDGVEGRERAAEKRDTT